MERRIKVAELAIKLGMSMSAVGVISFTCLEVLAVALKTEKPYLRSKIPEGRVNTRC